MNLGMNRDRSRSSVPHRDIPRPSQHFKINRPTNLKRAIKGSNNRSKTRQRNDKRSRQNKQRRTNCPMANQESINHGTQLRWTFMRFKLILLPFASLSMTNQKIFSPTATPPDRLPSTLTATPSWPHSRSQY